MTLISFFAAVRRSEIAFCICSLVASESLAVSLDESASFFIFSAMMAKPLPDSPALAASILAFSASRFVSSATFVISSLFSSSLTSRLWIFPSASFSWSQKFTTSLMDAEIPVLSSALLLLPSDISLMEISRLSKSTCTSAINSAIFAFFSCNSVFFCSTSEAIVLAISPSFSTSPFTNWIQL